MATYKESGVDIEAGNKAVRLMRGHVRSTYRDGVLDDIGGFGGLFKLDTSKYREPVMVSGADGVGTKLRIAFLMDKHDTIGIDAVAMCVNDIVVPGAEPLFFLDYLATGRIEPEKVATIVGGIAAGCREAGCALLGGETAEMPSFYQDGEYDLAGFAVGVVEHDALMEEANVETGDVLIGLPSSGLHSNGYSLVRKIFLETAGWQVDKEVPEFGRTLGEELLIPTTIYVRPIVTLLQEVKVRAMVHITGGGFKENIPRSLPQGKGAVIEKKSFIVPPVFSLLQQIGNVAEEEMYRTFNMGIGFVVIVSSLDADKALASLRESGLAPVVIGSVSSKEGVFVR